jgi:alkylation response protein AidB-like acyl-CoA dehydrogenase
MDLALSREDREVQARAREFTEKFLFPYELENEENGGGLSDQTHAILKQAVIDYRLGASNHAVEDGGQGYTMLQQTLLSEEVGRSSGCMWDVVWAPAVCLRFATPEQKRTYLVPANRGDRREAYAITEKDAGSDPRLVKTAATRRNGKFYLNGEKWFVTSGDVADYLLVHAHVDGDPDKPTIFIVDKDLPGVRIKRKPKFTHTFPFHHPEIVFEEVELDQSRILGRIGDGFELTKDWFVEARIGIAARCVGGAIRATEVANAFAAERVQFGKPIRDHQAIEFMLADMAVEIMAAKAMLYQVSWEYERADRRRVHAKASAAKLYCSEMAGRVVDKAVQIMGGRGYMRENTVERLWRDLRVDRIWEGTSEIQRMIIGGQIKKRGLEVYTGWVDA